MGLIAIDFDGTVVTHDFPNIGKEIGAVPVLKELIANGHQLILWTVRSDVDPSPNDQFVMDTTAGRHLTNAIAWFEKNGIELWGINRNPTQAVWSKSPKAHADIFIDDLSLGTPLIHDKSFHPKPFVDWIKIRELLIQLKYIK